MGRTFMKRQILLSLFLVFVAACGSGTPVADGGQGGDTGPMPDAGPAPDGGQTPDGGLIDSGTDGGQQPDSGTGDAGYDGGQTSDGGQGDGGSDGGAQLGGIKAAVSSATRITTLSAEIYLYYGDLVSPPTCAFLKAAANLPVATSTFTLPSLPGNHTFDGFAAGGSITVFVKALNATGDYIGSGCVEGIAVETDKTKDANVSLIQFPSVLTGEFDLLESVTLGNQLPTHYQNYLNVVTRALANPAAVLNYYMLRQIDALLGLGLLVVPGSSPPREATIDEVFASPSYYSTWNYMSTTLDTSLSARSGGQGQRYADTKSEAAAVRPALSSFDLGIHFKVTAGGTQDTLHVKETWSAAVNTWWYGCGSGHTNTGCARLPLRYDNGGLPVLNVEYEASVSYAPQSSPPVSERYKLAPDPHNVPFSYARLVLWYLGSVFYYSLGCSDCEDLGDFIKFLVDCNDVGTWLAGQIPGITPQQGVLICNQASGATGTDEETYIFNYNSTGVEPRLSTRTGGGEFYLVDADQDLKTELAQDLKTYLQWLDESSVHIQDVTEPIVGYGRYTSSGCKNDNDCKIGASCQLIPHYLEVRSLETDCRRIVGSTPGREACSQDSDCRSGVCAGLGLDGGTSGLCFAACTEDIQCPSGVCDHGRVQVDLDDVRSGLGKASGSGCNP
jgi:hypothetical protein